MGCGHPEWLPVDWKVRVKIRSCGKKDKYYVNPSNNLKFNSKPEVLRYLESSGKDNTRDPDKLCAEAKGQRLINQKVDESLCSNEMGKSEQREGDDSLEFKRSDKPQPAKRKKLGANITRESKKLVNNKEYKSAAGDHLLKSGAKVASLEKADAPAATNVDDSLFRNKIAQMNENERHKGGRRQSKRLAGNKLNDNSGKDQLFLSGPVGAEEKNVIVPEMMGSKQSETEKNSMEGQQDGNLAVQKKKTNSKRKWASDLPRRTSKRLARVEADSSLEVKTSVKTRTNASGLLGEAEVTTTGKAVTSNKPDADSKVKYSTENKIDDNQEKPSVDSNLSSPVHKCVGPDSKDNIKEEHLDSSLNDLLMDPCIEFAIKTLTGAIPFEEVATKVNNSSTSSLASPSKAALASTASSVNIWADPCFEFAVKTLTSDAPIENRNGSSSEFQIRFQQPLSSSEGSSLTLQKFKLDNAYPSNYSFSPSDAVSKPYVRQQGVGDQHKGDFS